MNELTILAAALHSRRAHESIADVARADDVLSDQGRIVLDAISHYYQQDPDATHVDSDWLVARLSREYERHAAAFEQLVRKMPDVSPPNVEEEYLAYRRKAVGEKMAGALLMGNDISELLELYNSTELKVEAASEEIEIYKGASLEDISQVVAAENLVPLHPATLNDAMGGGLPLGAHVIIFARPEAGKSLTAINIACNAVANGYPVLYVGNEDPAKLMLLRVFTRLARMTRTAVLANQDEAMAKAREHGYDLLTFAHLTPGTVDTVEKLIVEHKPKLLILDQLTNLKTGKTSSKTDHFETVAYEIRQLLGKYHVAGVSFCQAGESADNKLMLEMTDVYMSKTGVAAQADAMLGIGFNQQYDSMSPPRRMLTFCKNKLGGEHSSHTVELSPQYSAMRGV